MRSKALVDRAVTEKSREHYNLTNRPLSCRNVSKVMTDACKGFDGLLDNVPSATVRPPNFWRGLLCLDGKVGLSQVRGQNSCRVLQGVVDFKLHDLHEFEYEVSGFFPLLRGEGLELTPVSNVVPHID